MAGTGDKTSNEEKNVFDLFYHIALSQTRSCMVGVQHRSRKFLQELAVVSQASKPLYDIGRCDLIWIISNGRPLLPVAHICFFYTIELFEGPPDYEGAGEAVHPINLENHLAFSPCLSRSNISPGHNFGSHNENHNGSRYTKNNLIQSCPDRLAACGAALSGLAKIEVIGEHETKNT